MELENINMKVIFGTIMGAVILVLVVLVVFDALSIGTTEVETFAVTDSSVDNTNTLTNTPAGGSVTVEQWTGASWQPVAAAHVTVNERQVTVAAAGMF
jgi:hypothetical protein